MREETTYTPKRAEKMKGKLLFLIVVPLILYIILLPAMPLMEPDEARYSDIPSLMNSTGDYVTPHLHHVVYLEKPPLSYWATALSFRIFGENDFSSRLFVGLCAWGCIILVYCMGVFFSGKKTGLYSAGILTTFFFHFILGRINTLDIPLAFFVCLAIWAGYRHIQQGGKGRAWIYLFYFSSALAFLTKGLIGIVFPFAILILWLLISRRWRAVFTLFSPVGILILLAVSCPWIILAQKANKDFLWFFFVQEHFLRYTTTMHGKENSILYYVPILIAGTVPWCAFLFEVMTGAVDRKISLRGELDWRFLLTWAIFVFVFFSLSSSKLIPYMTPLFLPVAVIFGHLFSLYDGRGALQRKRMLVRLPVVLQSFIFIVLLCVPLFIARHNIAASEWFPRIALPILALVMLVFVPEILKKRWDKGWFLSIYLISTLLMASLLPPLSHFLTPYKSAYPVSQAIKILLPPGEGLFQYGISDYGIDFYSKIRTPVVDDFGELSYGIGRLSPDERSRYFLTSEDFFRLCREKGDIYCVTKYERRVARLREKIPEVQIIWDNGAYFLLRLRC
ncbi:MAG: glycosyltransferase family 39 protein [Syntrophobacterales bacterium]|nr:MAG: glycosyltransferase family 39 protein [Syntrophobacterales bacterium]